MIQVRRDLSYEEKAGGGDGVIKNRRKRVERRKNQPAESKQCDNDSCGCRRRAQAERFWNSTPCFTVLYGGMDSK